MTGLATLWNKFQDSGAQDNRRNIAVKVHVMKCLLLCVFSHAAACRLVGGGLGTTLRISIWRDFSVAMYLYLYMYM